MMLLTRMRLGQKLALLVLVPVVVIAYFALTQTHSSSKLRDDADRLVQLAGLGVQLSALVHELQKERGMSAGYIGSAGAKFAANLSTQRKQTDAVRAALSKYLRKFNSSALDQGAATELAAIRDELDRTGTMRKSIDGLSVSLGDALPYYTNINSHSLSLIARMAKLSADAALTREIIAYASFLQSKERAGIERAVMANTFAKDSFGPGMFVKFLQLKTTQENYMAMFLELATPELSGFYQQTLSGEAIDETRRMRKVAMDHADSGGFGIDAVYWFEMQTAKINMLKAVEDQAAEMLNASAQASRAVAESALYRSVAISVAGLLISVVLGWYLVRSILAQLGGEPAYIAEIATHIANGELDTPLRDERGDSRRGIYASIVAMRDTLRERIESDRRAAQENLRIRTALDGANAGVMVADANGDVIYVNGAVRRMFEQAADDLRCVKPSFDPRTINTGAANDLLKGIADDPRVIDAVNRDDGRMIEAGARTFRVLATPVVDAAGGRLGTAIEWSDLTEDLAAAEAERERLEQERIVAAANTRLKVALDNVGSAVVVADNDRRIIYANKSAFRLFDEARDDIRTELKGFDSESIVGQRVDALLEEKGRSAASPDMTAESRVSDVEIGTRAIRITTNSVTDDNGNRLGTTVEWLDRTNEVAVEREIDNLVAAAGQGDLSQRIELSGKEGFFKQLGYGFNALIDQLSGVFSDIAEVMGKLADGDLRTTITREYSGTFDDVKSDVNRTMRNLAEIVGRLADVADHVDSTVGEIAIGNRNLSSRTEQQASNLEQTASSLEQLTATVRNNAGNAQQANDLATSARSIAQRGGEVVSEAISAMDQINSSSKKIGEIVGVIDEIAFQTNLLALNASVEAARAGEQGRGFAVVATEVRNLASRSADAAKEIKDLIEDSTTKVDAGSELVGASGETLSEIVDSVKKVGEMVAEIAAASSEQAAGIDQINRAVSEMDNMTQQNAALAEETSAASISVGDNAQELKRLINFFATK